MNAGKKKAMEKFLFNALTVDLQENHKTRSFNRNFGKRSNFLKKMTKSDINSSTDAESVTFVAGTTRTRFG